MSVPEPQKLKNSGPSPVLIVVALMAVFAFIVAAALVFITRSTELEHTGSHSDNGLAIVDGDAFSTGVNDLEPKAVTDYALIRADGTPLNVADLGGKYALLYFGYTHCPDFCPSTMSDWRLIRRGLGDEADSVAFVMISVDPERDTPEMLTRYLQPFDPAIIGATSDEVTLHAMADEFGAYFEPVADDESPLYMVNHTASQFLLDPQGNFVTVYSFGTPVDVVTDDLRAKLAIIR